MRAVWLDGEPGNEEARREAWDKVFRRGAALPFQYYGEVLEPQQFSDGPFGLGDLSDDLADIYGDLTTGQRLHARPSGDLL